MSTQLPKAVKKSSKAASHTATPKPVAPKPKVPAPVEEEELPDAGPAPNEPKSDPKYYVWYRRDGEPFPFAHHTKNFHDHQKTLAKPKHATQEIPKVQGGRKPGQSLKAKVAGPIPPRSVDDARVGAASSGGPGQRGQRQVVGGSLPKNPPAQLVDPKRGGLPAVGSKRDADSDLSEGGPDM